MSPGVDWSGPASKFSELLDKMPARERENAHALTQSMAAELAFAKLRKAFDVSQADLAKALNVSQASVSEIEHCEDMSVSTLAAYVQAGGCLGIVAHFPKRTDGQQTTIRLRPFAVRATQARFD